MTRLERCAAGAVLLFAVAAFATCAEAKTIGIWKDSRSHITSGLTNSLDKAGWEILYFERNDLENAEKLAKTDVMLLHGGHNAYFFASPKARLNLIRYAAGGKGVLAAGFRSGWVRTANRPMFPEIGAVYNRVQSSWVGPVGDSPLAKAFGGKTIPLGGHDHLCLRVGKWGEVFCKSSDDPVGAFGDFYCGRVVVFGGHFMFRMVDETREAAEKLLFSQLKYLTGCSKPSEGEATIAVRKAEAEFIRREMMLTYAQDDRGPDRNPGIIPEWRDKTTTEPDALAYKLEYFAGFLDRQDADKCRGQAKRLFAMTENVRKAAAKEMETMAKRLERMEVADLALFFVRRAEFFDVEKYKSSLKALVRGSEVEAAKKLAGAVLPKVRAAKAKAVAKEIAEDMKLVPALVEKISSKCPKERYEAALEIGRISPDDGAAVAALVKAIDDADEKVRVQAVISLGWMQAKGAVDALVKTASSKCPFMRRRALQALGLIGDQKAIPAVMKALDDTDAAAVKCATIALGHLKATAAVERLLAIAEDTKANKRKRSAAIIALGEIGDKRAFDRLAKLGAEAKDISKSKRGAFPMMNYLSDTQSIGITLSSTIATNLIAKGGRAAPGVKQPDEYRTKDGFYAITGRFNALAGRTETVRGPFVGLGQKLLMPHLKNAGFTGVHNAWGWSHGWTPDDFADLVREADDMGLIWIDVMPGRWVLCDYASMEANFLKFDDITAYRGVWAEETWPEQGGGLKEFKAFLAERYGDDWAKALKLRDDEIKAIDSLDPNWIAFSTKGPDKKLEAGFAPPWDGAVRTLIVEYNAYCLDRDWHESQEYLHARRKGFSQTYVISTADPSKVIGGMQAAERLDSFGHESYECFGRGSSYFMERYRNGGAARSVMSEQYHWYCPSNAHALRGFWQNAMHSKCYYDFALHQMFEQPSWYDNWSWERGRWDAAKEVFRRIAKTPDLYAIAPSAANAAVVFSERSSSAVKEQVYFQCAIPVRNDHNVMAAWTAMSQLHVPCDIVWAETLDKAKISKYKFLYLPSAKYLGDAEIEALREWVKEGGVLVAEGTTSLFGGHSLKNRGNYALADVFGCDWKDTVFRTGKDSDTFATRHDSPVSAYKVVPGIDNLLHMDDSIHREVKPEKSIVVAKVAADAGEFLPGLEKGAEIEMDGALGCDVVKPTTAKVLAVFKKGGAPAILANDFGKGRSYFIAANYFAHAHVTSRWEMMPGRFDFWKNVTEALGAMAKSGYAKAGATLPVEVSGVSKEVEVTVDDQGSRYVVQMLDYDVNSDKVAGAKLFVPGERKIKRVYYPGAKEPLKLDGRAAALRDFSVYDMFVVEFED
ncbi:MAG: HEAT repeat domain-containing protein [Kiritimatiellae bacterium]|nr:HEAT repeat domain-containing protein [Kiritimatiellia bacterium]